MTEEPSTSEQNIANKRLYLLLLVIAALLLKPFYALSGFELLSKSVDFPFAGYQPGWPMHFLYSLVSSEAGALGIRFLVFVFVATSFFLTSKKISNQGLVAFVLTAISLVALLLNFPFTAAQLGLGFSMLSILAIIQKGHPGLVLVLSFLATNCGVFWPVLLILNLFALMLCRPGASYSRVVVGISLIVGLATPGVSLMDFSSYLAAHEGTHFYSSLGLTTVNFGATFLLFLLMTLFCVQRSDSLLSTEYLVTVGVLVLSGILVLHPGYLAAILLVYASYAYKLQSADSLDGSIDKFTSALGRGPSPGIEFVLGCFAAMLVARELQSPVRRQGLDLGLVQEIASDYKNYPLGVDENFIDYLHYFSKRVDMTYKVKSVPCNIYSAQFIKSGVNAVLCPSQSALTTLLITDGKWERVTSNEYWSCFKRVL